MPIDPASKRHDLVYEPEFLDRDPLTRCQSLRLDKGSGHWHDIGIKEGNFHSQQTSSLGFADRAVATLEAAVGFCNSLKNSR